MGSEVEAHAHVGGHALLVVALQRGAQAGTAQVVVDADTDNSFGIGVNYDLGGARLGASLQRDYQERVTADMGVRFDF